MYKYCQTVKKKKKQALSACYCTCIKRFDLKKVPIMCVTLCNIKNVCVCVYETYCALSLILRSEG